MTAKDRLAARPAATVRSPASCRRDAQPSIARTARNERQSVSGLVHDPEETEMTYETLLVETRGRVGLVTLNRPQALNALNSTVMRELAAALKAFDADKEIGAVVLAGSEK